MKTLQFYDCTPTANLEIAGTWPQVNDFESNPVPIAAFIDALLPTNWDRSPMTATLSMNISANWTDLMTSFLTPEYAGMLVSGSTKALFQNYRLPPHRWIDMGIVGKNREHRTYTILNYNPDCAAIDYPSSILFHRFDKAEIQFDSYRDWVAHAKAQPFPPPISPKRLVLSTPIDLLLIPFSTQVIVSENLKKAIEDLGLTGFEFESITMEVLLA